MAGGIFSSLRKKTWMLMAVRVPGPVLRRCPSIKVDFPPERLVDSLMTRPEMGRLGA